MSIRLNWEPESRSNLALQEEFIVSKENSIIGTFKEVSSESLGLDFGLNTGYEKRVLLFEDWLFVLVVLFFKGQFKTWCSEETQYKQRFSFLLLSFSSGVKGSWVRLEYGLKKLVEFGLLLNEKSSWEKLLLLLNLKNCLWVESLKSIQEAIVWSSKRD